MNLKLFLIAAFLATTNSCDLYGDFYWRDYNGTIPGDAIPAGRNSYIGQAYIHNYGLLLGTIFPGKLEISVPCYGVKKANVTIKILCAKIVAKYYWLPTRSATYQEDTAGKCPVLGGYDQKVPENLHLPLGTLHVGRTRSHGDAIIGNIAVYNPTNPIFYYPLNDTELSTSKFDVLVSHRDYKWSVHEQ